MINFLSVMNDNNKKIGIISGGFVILIFVIVSIFSLFNNKQTIDINTVDSTDQEIEILLKDTNQSDFDNIDLNDSSLGIDSSSTEDTTEEEINLLLNNLDGDFSDQDLSDSALGI